MLGFLVPQMVKNPPCSTGDLVQSLSQEDALAEDMATHCSILAWRSPWMEDTGELQLRSLAGISFLLCHMAYGILVPLLGIEPTYIALEGLSLGPWTTGEISVFKLGCFLTVQF